MQGDFGLQRGADLALDAQLFERLGDVGAPGADLVPLVEQGGLVFRRGQWLPGVQHHRVVLAMHRAPGFFGGEGEDGRHQFDEGFGDVPQRALRGAPGRAAGGAGVQAVLKDVEVEAAQVFGAEGLQRLHHAVEFVLAVVGLALRLQLARHGQRVAVDLQPRFDR